MTKAQRLERLEYEAITSPSQEQPHNYTGGGGTPPHPVNPVVPRRKKTCHCRCSFLQPPNTAKDRAKRIDIWARWLYPLVFVLFNCIYWGYYLNLNPELARIKKAGPP